MTDYSSLYSIDEYRVAKLYSSLLMAVFCLICIPALGLFGKKAIETVVFTAFMLLMSIGELQVSYYFQHDQVGVAGKSLAFRSLLALGLFLICYCVTKNIVLSGIAMLAGAAIGLLPWRIKGKWKALSLDLMQRGIKLLLMCMPLFISSFLVSITINVPKYVINFVSSDSVQGYFGMLLMPPMVIALLSQIVFKPVLHDYSIRLQTSSRQFYSLLRKHIILIALLTLVCVGICMVIGAKAMSLVYGISFEGLTIELNLMVACGGLLAACQLMYYLFVLLRAQKDSMILNIAAFCLCIILGVIFVPTHGLLGAVLSLIGTQLVLFIAYCIVINIRVRRAVER